MNVKMVKKSRKWLFLLQKYGKQYCAYKTLIINIFTFRTTI